jgi:ssDNA-binding Zn-finger/Zn-ribbon topoisomerase 1
MDDKLKCPICGRQMEYKYNERFQIGKSFISASHYYTCDREHENITVSLYEEKGEHFVQLGDGFYHLKEDMISCQKAIDRMKLEYDCGKFMEHFE